jgi:hypothetical protein
MQAVPPDPAYPVVLRAGEPMRLLAGRLAQFPRGTGIERDCFGNIRAVPPGAPAGPGPATEGPAATAPRHPSALAASAVVAKLLTTPGVDTAQSIGGGFFAVKTTLSAERIAQVTGGTVSPERLYSLEGYTTEPAETNDPLMAKAWFLADWGQGGVGDFNNDGGGWWSTPGASADAQHAWPTSMGAGVTIADIDTGVPAGISELQGRVSPSSENFMTTPPSSDVAPVGTAGEYDHGTLVATTMVGNAGNGAGAAGVAPEATVMNLKCSDNGSLSDSCIYQAGEYAIAHGARIINMSFGGEMPSDPLMASLVSDANKANVLVVASAGNSQADNDTTSIYPADFAETYPNVISVGASDMLDNMAGFSDYGASSVDLFAPGYMIVAQEPTGAFVFWNGTSASAPMVSGTAALMLSADPSLTPEQVKADIMATVDHPSSLAGDSITGGRLDAAAAVAGVKAPVTFSYTGVGDLQPATAGTVGVTAQASSYSGSASSLQLHAQLAYAYNNQMYGVIGQALSWSGDGQTGNVTTSPNGDATLGSFSTVDFTTSGVTVAFPLALPQGTYALVTSLVDPTSSAVVGEQAVFFQVGSPAPTTPTTTSSGTTTATTATTATVPATVPVSIPTTTPQAQVPTTAAPATTRPVVTPTTTPQSQSPVTTAPATTRPVVTPTTTPQSQSPVTTAPATTRPATTPTMAPPSTTMPSSPMTTARPVGTTTPATTPSTPAPPTPPVPVSTTSTTAQGTAGPTTSTTARQPTSTTVAGKATTTVPGTTAPTTAPVIGGSTPTTAGATTTTIPLAHIYGLTQVTPNTLSTAGGDLTVFGSALPQNAVVKVGASYEPVLEQEPGYLDVVVVPLAPGTYTVTVWNAQQAASDTLPQALTVTSTGLPSGSGVSATTTTPTGSGGSSGSPSPATTQPNATPTTIATTPPTSQGSTTAPTRPSTPTSTATTPPDVAPTTGAGAPARTTSTTAPATAPTTAPATAPTTAPATAPTTAPATAPTTAPATAPTNQPVTTTSVAPPFQAPNGLTLGGLGSAYGITGVPAGTWNALVCQAAICPGVTISPDSAN